jgi:hypothetical protein
MRRRFVREALETPVDLAVLRAKPSPRVWTGLALVGLSYLVGWPAVALLAWLALRWQEPLLVVVGGPLTYGLSHLVFMAGAWLAGSGYVRVLLRWATRRAVEWLGGAPAPLS